MSKSLLALLSLLTLPSFLFAQSTSENSVDYGFAQYFGASDKGDLTLDSLSVGLDMHVEKASGMLIMSRNFDKSSTLLESQETLYQPSYGFLLALSAHDLSLLLKKFPISIDINGGNGTSSIDLSSQAGIDCGKGKATLSGEIEFLKDVVDSRGSRIPKRVDLLVEGTCKDKSPLRFNILFEGTVSDFPSCYTSLRNAYGDAKKAEGEVYDLQREFDKLLASSKEANTIHELHVFAKSLSDQLNSSKAKNRALRKKIKKLKKLKKLKSR